MPLIASTRLLHGGLDAALHVHRIETRRQQLDSLGDDAAGQHGRGGGAVAGDIGGLLRDFAQQAGADVLELIFEFELPDHGDAVLGHLGRAEAFLNQDVASLGTQRYPGRLGHQGGPFDNSRPRSFV